MARAPSSPLLLVLSAPSGCGKTTIAQRLLAANLGLSRVVTCTTRGARGAEVDGVDYHFLSEAEFLRRVAANEFLEHAAVYGHHYGTLRSAVWEILNRGRDALLVNDVQGAAAVARAGADDPALRRALASVFVMPENLEVLRARLQGRAEDSAAVIERRLAEAGSELAQWRHFDYVVRSGTPEEDWRRVQAIYEAEGLRITRGAPFAEG